MFFTCIGVAGCWLLSSLRVTRIKHALRAIMKVVPTSDSIAELLTDVMILARTWIGLLGVGGFMGSFVRSVRLLLRKN